MSLISQNSTKKGVDLDSKSDSLPPTSKNTAWTYFWRYRFWTLVPMWTAICLWYFIFESSTSAEDSTSLLSRLRVTGEFAISEFVIIYFFILVIFFVRVRSREPHPIALHIWRCRWRYFLIPYLPSIIALLLVMWSEAANQSLLSLSVTSASIVLLTSAILIWLISAFYLMGAKRRRWLVACFIFPPLAIILFIRG